MATQKSSLFSRLPLRQKFGILGLLALAFTGVAFFAYIHNQQNKIDVIKKEQQGLFAAKELLALLHSLSQHRGSSTVSLNGNTAMEQEEQDLKAVVEQQLLAFATTRKMLKNPESQKIWQDIQTQWPALIQKAAERSVSPGDHFIAHTALIAEVLAVLDLVVDEYGLSLDPTAESYFLVRATLIDGPLLTEYLGQARTWGGSLLAKSAKPNTALSSVAPPTKPNPLPIISLQERSKLSFMTGIARSYLTDTLRDLAKVGKYRPGLDAPLHGPLLTVAEQITQALALSETEIVAKTTPTYHFTDYDHQYAQAIDRLFSALDTGLKLLDTLFDRQIKAATEELLTISVIIAGLLLISAVAAIAIVRSITRPVGHLLEVMQKLATWDTKIRANLTGTDEIGLLARQFDELIDQREALRTQADQENEQLNNSIVNLLLSVAKLAQKDLTVNVTVEENVTGPLADALNLLSKETAGVMQKVTAIAREVAEVSQQMEVQAAHVIVVATEEKSEVEHTASELNHASLELRAIAELAAACNTAAEKAIHNTEQAQTTVLETISGITAIRDTIRETEKRIKLFGERSQEIGSVVNLINEIAERTHILALNAAMHAASAGEAGRGFAVVTGEVQKLAENSREATSKISSLVNNIQVETADTVATMNNAISQVVLGT